VNAAKQGVSPNAIREVNTYNVPQTATAQPESTAISVQNHSRTTIDRAIEVGWLIAIALIPIAALPEGTMAGFIGGPKVFLLRSLAIALAALATVGWLTTLSASAEKALPTAQQAKALVVAAITRLRARPVVLAALAVLAANLIAYLLSPVKPVSWAGFDPGFDSYSLMSVSSYLVLFGVIAAHLRTEAQLRRLLWTLSGTAMLLGIYGVGQRFGLELFKDEAIASGRVTLTFGNPIFASAYMLMTIPLTLALWQAYRPRFTAVVHAAIGGGLIALQTYATVFTLSRGPNIAFAFGLIVFVILVAWVYGRRFAVGPASSIALAIAFVVVLNFVPVPGLDDSSSQFADRASTVGTELGGGLAGRYVIWEKSWELFTVIPWVDNDLYPELPSLPLQQLRRIFGYGPDIFGGAYQVAGGAGEGGGGGSLARHAHNFPLHTLVELGLLGLLAYLALIAAVGYVLFGIMRTARHVATPSLVGFLAIGLSTVLAARLLEQLAGKAQISDLALSWALAGLVAALASMQDQPTTSTLAPRHRRSTAPAVKRQSGRKPTPRSALNGTTILSALVAVAALLTWWQGPLSDSRSLVLSARATNAAVEGDSAHSGTLFNQAIDASPSGTIPRLLLVQGLFNAAELESDPPVAKAELDAAYEVNDVMRDRDPISYRAWQYASRISLAQAQLDPALWSAAVYDNQVAVHLNPGQWTPLERLSWALALAGDTQEALDAARTAKTLGAENNPQAFLIYYIESLIEGSRGNFVASDAALAVLETFSHPDVPALVDRVKALPR
jgi:O-antigen ligase